MAPCPGPSCPCGGRASSSQADCPRGRIRDILSVPPRHARRTWRHVLKPRERNADIGNDCSPSLALFSTQQQWEREAKHHNKHHNQSTGFHLTTLLQKMRLLSLPRVKSKLSFPKNVSSDPTSIPCGLSYVIPPWLSPVQD